MTTSTNITNLRSTESGLDLIAIADRLGMLAHKASALNLAIRGLDFNGHEGDALDYLSQELAEEIDAFRKGVDGENARRRKVAAGKPPLAV